MKKLVYYIVFALALGLNACKEDSFQPNPIEQSFEDPNEAMERYLAKINESDAGWEFLLAGRQGGFYTGFLDFGADNMAKFTVDLNSEVGAALTDVGYRFAVSQSNPTLGFPRGSLFSTFASSQAGLDTVFAFKAIVGDTIFLSGDNHASELKLIKTSASKAQAYENGGIATTIENAMRTTQLPRYFKRLVLNGVSYDLHFNPALKTLYIHYGGTQNFQVHQTYYGRTATGLYLQTPLVDGANTISYIDGFAVNLASGTMTAVINGATVPLTNETAPSAYDISAARTFFNNPPRQITITFQDGPSVERYSRNLNGYTVAGVPDAYGISSIPDFQFLPFFHTWGGQPYGTVRFVLSGSSGLILSSYGPVFTTLFSANGLIAFYYEGDFGTYPADIIPLAVNFILAFREANGHYVIRSGSGAYDIVSVSATGGQKWIRFD